MISIDPRALRLAAAAAFAAAALPAIAGPIVVRAVGPSAASYPPGQKLADSATLVLKAGDQVTVLDAKGTRSFAGPGNYRFDQASAAATPTAFAELLTQKSERRARIGAVRGAAGAADGPATPPGIWAIDAGIPGTVCAINTGKMSLWRANPMTPGNYTVTRVADGKSTAMPFASGQAIAAWPADFVPATGGSFRISGGAAPTTITVKTLAKPPGSLDELGAALLDAGCQSQFERLAAVTKTTAS